MTLSVIRERGNVASDQRIFDASNDPDTPAATTTVGKHALEPLRLGHFIILDRHDLNLGRSAWSYSLHLVSRSREKFLDCQQNVFAKNIATKGLTIFTVAGTIFIR